MSRGAVSMVELTGMQQAYPGLWEKLVEIRAIRITMQAESDFLEGRPERGEVGLNWLRRWAGDRSDIFVQAVEVARLEYQQRLGKRAA